MSYNRGMNTKTPSAGIKVDAADSRTSPTGETSGESSAVIEQWRSMQSAYLATSSALDRALNEQYDLGLSEFEILDLVSGPHETEDCTMRDLLQLTPMTQSALSRVVDRLQKAGLVERNECSWDRRSMFVGMTKSGKKVHAEAKQLYTGMLAQQLG
jgi:DNA-binding MarR family transcriptional regulator